MLQPLSTGMNLRKTALTMIFRVSSLKGALSLHGFFPGQQAATELQILADHGCMFAAAT